MDKIWLKHYPPGMPSEVDLHEYASLPQILDETCARFRALPAVSNMGATLTYSELDAATRDFAAYLQRTLQLPKGERVAIMMPNLLQYPVVTGYKLPRIVEFRTEPLPKTNIGKVLRRLLRDTKAGQEQTA